MTSDTTLRELEQKTIQAVQDSKIELATEEYPEEYLHEIADSIVPVYNSTVLEIAANEPRIALEDPGIGADTPLQAIKYNLLRELERAAWEEWDRLKEEDPEVQKQLSAQAL